MKTSGCIVAMAIILFTPLSALSQEPKRAALSDAEEDKLREAQDPATRVELYVAYAQDRLSRFETFKNRPDNPQVDSGSYLDELLGEYISLNEEMKDWIEVHYEHHGDMRSGLRALLEKGPPQLKTLRGIEESPGPHAAAYAGSLRDAAEQLTDLLDGATKALAEQEKEFAQAKRDEKEAARISKERRKEEAKRTKEEEKLRKRQGKSRVPGEGQED